MASKDFLKLMDLIYGQNYKIHEIKISIEKIPETKNEFKEKATIILKKDSDVKTLTSGEGDFFNFGIHVKKIVNREGDFELIQIKDTEKYYKDIDFLVDDFEIKLDKAKESLMNGTFSFGGYNPESELDRFLFSDRRPKDAEIVKLKTMYYEIFAHYLLTSIHFMKVREKIISNPNVGKYVDLCDKLFREFLKIGNPIKDYKRYKSFVKIDLPEIATRAKQESDYIQHLFDSLVIKSPVSPQVGMRTTLDSYRRFCELLKQLINAIRIAIELKDGIEPKLHLSYIQNVDIIAKDAVYRDLIEFVDPHIRNTESHLSTEIDEKNKKVVLVDSRGTNKKVIKEYTFNEVLDLFNKLRQIVFPSIYTSLITLESALKGLILKSPEYKLLLLGLDNS